MKKSSNTIPWSYVLTSSITPSFYWKLHSFWLNFFYGTGRRAEFSQLFVNTEEIDISLSISVNNENLSR